MGTTGAMRWDTLAKVAGKAGFTTPYLRQAGAVNIVNDEYIKMLGKFSPACNVCLYSILQSFEITGITHPRNPNIVFDGKVSFRTQII